MIRSRLLATVISVTLVAGLSGATLAQDDEISLEDTDWALISYYDEEAGEFVDVPFEVQPTIRLEDGRVTGDAGCNQFSGGYDLDGSSLMFDQAMSVTLASCESPGQEVEDSYLAVLGTVGSWAFEGQQLQLYDNLGDSVLTYEVPSVSWTPTRVATLLTALEALQVEIDALRKDTDKLNVPTLRQRIKALEAENKKVTRRLTELEAAPAVDPAPKNQTTSSFSAAEKVLLKGIPTRIANYCNPLRSGLPKGSRAAITCRPNTNTVESVDYYLLDGSRAAAEFGSVMASYNVPDVAASGETCADGTKSQRLLIGNGWQMEGCYRENQTAQLRFVDNATDCKKLRAGGKTLGSPAIYVALQGASQDVARVYEWATKGVNQGSGQLTSITQPIPSNLAASPACVT